MLEKECPTPDITRIKGFIRWYTYFTKGRLSLDRRPTMITTLVYTERFFGGFKIAIGNMIATEDRSETYGVSIVRFVKGL